MPLKNQDDYGTDSKGKKVVEYCRHCFQWGEFVEPEITMEKMIERVACSMIKDMGMDVDQAVNVAVTLIPKLKRWQ